MSVRRRVLIAVNAHSRRGGSSLDPAARVFEAAGWSVRREAAPRSSGIPAIVREHQAAVDVIVLAGGDGTLNAAADVLLESGKPVGILPLGTANDLARTLGIPRDLVKAAETVVSGSLRPVDIGMVNQRPYFNVASLGMSVALTKGLSRSLKKRFGRLSYALAGAKALLEMRPFDAEVVDGAETFRTRCVQIAVGNGRRYGGHSTVAPDARIDDGCLDLYCIETTSLVRLALMLPAFRSGRHGSWQGVRTKRGRSFRVTTDPVQEIVADGKIIAETPALFRLRPAALHVFTPRPED